MTNFSHSPLLCAIAAHAATVPDKTALVAGNVRVTYGQLLDKTLAAASALRSLGVETGDNVLLSAHKSPEFIYLYLAGHLLGAVNVVVDESAPQERIEYIAQTVKPALLLFHDDRTLDGCCCTCWTNLDYSVSVPRVSWPQTALSPDDIADVMFTTGTTGRPKGVCLSHANIAGSAANTNGFIGTCSSDIEALALPLGHSFGLGRMRCVFTVGGTLLLVNNFANLKAFFQVIETQNVTGFGMVPAVWQYIKRLSGRRIARFAGQLRYIEMGSAALPVEDKRLLAELFPDTRLCMHYGLTEASRALFAEFHDNADRLDAVGSPASPLVQVSVMDEGGAVLPDGVDGEICVRGNMVATGYFLPQDNADAYHEGRWFRTGDWGHRDASGDFYLTGRKKELINIGGEKVSPATIEDAIRSLGIDDCACVAVPDPNGVLGEVPKAFLQRGTSPVDLDELKQRLTAILPPHEIPVQWEWIDRIPRTASGKIQRLKLK